MRRVGRTDLFKLAEKNAAALESRFEELKALRPVDEAAQIDRFADRVHLDGRVSVNMRPSVLSYILLGRKHQSIHEWAEEQAGTSGRPASEILQEKLHENHDARLAFEDSFEQGRKFRYGCLNIGGAGPVSKYGQFCCVLKSDFPWGKGRIAYLRGDSLRMYVSTDNKTNVEALSRDAAAQGSRHHLAALKHGERILGAEEEMWPEIVCSDADYIEAVFTEVVGMGELGEVRVPGEEYDRLWDLAFGDFGKSLTDDEHALRNVFVMILREVGRRSIELRRVCNA
ncbi:MAG: hypothetical protein JW759_01415 [Candidatus Coatesbacteria bacterium]|nr:hypothetical protein [Candidatus Coatesbacteria bacterium]